MLGYGVILAFLVVNHFAIVVFEHLRMGDTGVSNITSHVEVHDTLIGDDLEEGGASRSRSTEHEDHLARSQDPGVPGKKIRRKENILHVGDPPVNNSSNGWRL